MKLRARRNQWLCALVALALASGCDSSYVSYSHDGVQLNEGVGKPGAERGLWTFRYFDGSLRARGHYDDQGRRMGAWETFFRNGQRESMGERVWVPESHGSLRTGPWTFWHENGFQRSQGNYSNGLREGPWVFTNPDGSPDTKRTGTYKADALISPGLAPTSSNHNGSNEHNGSE